MPLFSVKTKKGMEKKVVDMIIERDTDEIHSALSPDKMNSYIIVEAENMGILERIIDEVPHAQKVLQGQMKMAEIEGFLEPTSDVENVTKGDIVEVIEGPYAGEKAKVETVEQSSEGVTVTMVDAAVPIPVSLPGGHVKRIESEERGPQQDE